MMRNLVVKSESAKPAIGQVQFDLLAQLTLGADAIAAGNDPHTDHELRVDRRATAVAVEGLSKRGSKLGRDIADERS